MNATSPGRAGLTSDQQFQGLVWAPQKPGSPGPGGTAGGAAAATPPPANTTAAMQLVSNILHKCFATIWSPRRELPNPLPSEAIRSSLPCFVERHTNKDCNSPGEDWPSGNSNHQSNRASSSPRCRSLTAGFGSDRVSHPRRRHCRQSPFSTALGNTDDRAKWSLRQ